VKERYFLTIRTGQSRRSSASRPEKGAKEGMKKGEGSIPGIAVLAKKPGTTLMDMPESEKIRSLGSLEIACSSLRRLAEARAVRKTVFHVQRSLSCLEPHCGGSNSGALKKRSTLARSHSGTRGR
jgi:hypothetical protein